MAADGPSGGASGEPSAGPTGGLIAIRRARWILIVAAGIWAAAAAATVLWINPSLSAAELEAGPPVWLTWAAPLFVGLFSAAGAWRLRLGLEAAELSPASGYNTGPVCRPVLRLFLRPITPSD